MTFLNKENSSSNNPLLLLKQNGNNIKLLKEKIDLFRKETILNNELNKKTRDVLASLSINNKTVKIQDKRPLYAFSKSNCFHSSKIKHNHTTTTTTNRNNNICNQNLYINDYVNHTSYWQPIWMFTDNPLYEYGNDIFKREKRNYILFFFNFLIYLLNSIMINISSI
jgi:hypothetical protein